MAVKREAIVEIKYDTKGAEKSLKDLEKQQDKTAESTETLQDSTENMTGALDSMLGQLGISTQTFTKVQGGLKATTLGFKSLRVAIAATGIGALIIAITSLVGWFTRTKRGQEELGKIMGAFSGVVGVLTDAMDVLGGAIFDAFNNPKEAVLALWEAIKTNVVNRVKAIPELFGAIGRSIKSALDLDFEGVKKGVSDVGQSIIQLNTGLDKGQQQAVLDGIANGYQKISDKAEQGAKASERETRLREAKINFLTREAQLEGEIANAKLESENMELSAQERLAKNIEAQTKIKELADERAKILNEEIDILKERQDLSNNTLEDDQQLAELQAQLIRLNKRRDDQLRTVLTKNKSITNEIKAQEKATDKQIEKEGKVDEKLLQRDQKAKERLAKLKEDKEIERVKEIEDAQIQAERLTEIENARFQQIKDNDLLTKSELEEQEYIHQENLTKIKEDAENKQKALKTKQEKSNQKLTQETIDMALAALSELGEGSKEIAVAIATINTFQAITKTLAEVPAPFGPIQAGIIGALGFKQVADIVSTPVPKKAAKGMIIEGPSHANGGVPIMTPNGMIEAEGDEAIVTAGAMRDPFLGKVVSWANEMAGGVPLAERGMRIGSASVNSQLVNAGGNIERAVSKSVPVLVTESLDAVRNEVAVSEQISTF